MELIEGVMIMAATFSALIIGAAGAYNYFRKHNM
jgi:hypothetical protein